VHAEKSATHFSSDPSLLMAASHLDGRLPQNVLKRSGFAFPWNKKDRHTEGCPLDSESLAGCWELGGLQSSDRKIETIRWVCISVDHHKNTSKNWLVLNQSLEAL
jgi:hypothetical protein